MQELIPVSLRSGFERLLRRLETEFPESRERIIIVRDDNLEAEIERIRSEKNSVDVAVPSAQHLKRIEKGIRALVFEGELHASSFVHIEGILAALRALQVENIPALLEIYKILTGKRFTKKRRDIARYIDNPKKLATILTFKLKPIEPNNPDELHRLNERLLQLLHAA